MLPCLNRLSDEEGAPRDSARRPPVPRHARRPTSSQSRVRNLRRLLLKWGVAFRHGYPWRFTSDAYRIFVAESMLHRTQVTQVLPVYREFISRFPTLSVAAQANPRTLHAILRPLGLTWRTRALIKSLRSMWSEHGEIPSDPESLLLVPGVGPYIAHATVCFSRNLSLPLVDTNTVRVIGRLQGLDLHGQARRRRGVITAIGKACSPSRPRDFYHALIDLAHTVCLPHAPRCEQCPLRTLPCAFASKRAFTSSTTKG